MGFFSDFSLSKRQGLSEGVRGCARAPELWSSWAWARTMGSRGDPRSPGVCQPESSCAACSRRGMFFSRVLVNTCASGSWEWCYIEMPSQQQFYRAPWFQRCLMAMSIFFKPFQYYNRETEVALMF